MCGICGIVGFDAPVEQDILDRMVRAIAHRGPDDQGTWRQGAVGLGSCRLSIIDIAGGHQPISNEDGTAWIVFNGEIYNFPDLRTFLEKRGHTFRTRTDTEAVLHLYEDFGAECTSFLNGIFAIAIWDVRKQELFLARDRLGVKPLYYSEVGGSLIFGSELKALMAHPGVKRDIDPVAVNEYLSFEYVPTPRTILSSVKRLEPGSHLRWNRKRLERQTYWNLSLSRSENRPPVHWRDYVGRLRVMLQDAVRQETLSDVPVGVLLSGGIDSSAVAAMMVSTYPGEVQSFSVAFEEPSFDESKYARMVAEALGTKHHEMTLTADMAAAVVPTLGDLLDEPFGDGSFLPTYILSRFARERVKVVLGGDGGDELFAGYPQLLAHRATEYYERLVPWWIRARLIPSMLDRAPVSFSNISLDFKLRRFISGRGVPLMARHHRWLGSFLDEEKDRLFQNWVRPVLNDTYAPAYRHERECDARLPLNRILYDDVKLYLEGDILFKVDRASMAASLEVRVPLLNRTLVDFVSAVPVELKLHRLTGKFLLKQAMAPQLPKAVIARPKKGFGMPVAHWLQTSLRNFAIDMLSPDRLKRQGWFDAAYVQTLLDDHLSHRRDNRKLLWTLLMFQVWHERWATGSQ